MPYIFITGINGETRSVSARPGTTVMEAIRDNGFDELEALCGGSCACATCHVFVDPEWVNRLPEKTSNEDALLDSSDNRRTTSRLSCQLPVTDDIDGLAVEIAPEG